MAKVHTTNPKLGSDPYSKRRSSSDAQGDLLGAFVRYGIKYCKSAVMVDYLLGNKSKINTAFKSMFDIDSGDLMKFAIKRFYRDVFSIDVNINLMKYRSEEGYGLYMHIPPQLSFEYVIEKARRRGFAVDIDEGQVKLGGGRLGYTTCYSFLFHCEDVKEKQIRTKKDFENFFIHDSRKRVMNRMEYLICKLFIWWYWGTVMDKTGWSLLESKRELGFVSVATSLSDVAVGFDSVPFPSFKGLESFSLQPKSLRVREIYLL